VLDLQEDNRGFIISNTTMSAAGGAGVVAGVGGAQPLDCIRAVSHYVNKILKPRDKSKEISGMKCLLVDKETVSLPLLLYNVAAFCLVRRKLALDSHLGQCFADLPS
jgi:hypothetical protein